jgi:hypothetical protein
LDALVPLVGSLLSWLRGVLATDVCPGDWAWAVSGLGALVGLLPGAGALLVAWLRGRAPAPVLVGIALVSAGLLPWMAFAGAGELFSRAAGGGPVPGLLRADRISLTTRVCFDQSQQQYLGAGEVSEVLTEGSLRAWALFVPLVLFPAGVVVLVWLQGRMGLRRTYRRANRFFWVPVVLLGLASWTMPAGATAQLWTGMLFGASAGWFAVAVLRPPARRAVAPARRPTAVKGAARVAPRPAAAAVAPAASGGPAPTPTLYRAPEQTWSAWFLAWARYLGAHLRRWWRIAPDTNRARFTERPMVGRDGSAPGRAPTPGTAPPAPGANPASGTAPPASGPVPPTPGPKPAAGPIPRPGPGSGPIPTPRRPATLVGPPTFRPARFELIRQLGSGGFGGVWLAHDHARRHPVALKAAHAPDPTTEQRIRREARALAAVRHPNCVPIFDLVDSRQDPGLQSLRGLVIVMAYLEGAALDQVVHRHGPADDRTAARTWVALADALDAAHRHGVLHRDVKPGNVLVDPGGRPHLIDFGIARGRSDATLTMHGFILGTPDFLAPEVARGEPATAASDTYQLAATMSFALTGTPPRGSHPDARSGLRAAADGGRPSHLPKSSAHLNLLRDCLADSPSSRPALPAVRVALERWLAGDGPPAPRADRRRSWAPWRSGRAQHTPPELSRR